MLIVNVETTKSYRVIEALEKWADRMELAEEQMVVILDEDLAAGER